MTISYQQKVDGFVDISLTDTSDSRDLSYCTDMRSTGENFTVH